MQPGLAPDHDTRFEVHRFLSLGRLFRATLRLRILLNRAFPRNTPGGT